MERFWEQCIFKYLRAEPEDHFFLLVSEKNLGVINLDWNHHVVMIIVVSIFLSVRVPLENLKV